MRKLFSEFFYIPKYGKVSEKAMLARVVRTAVVMVACLIAMCVTAYAYFSSNITSGSNIIKAANFQISVSVKITDENGADVPVTTSNYQSLSAQLEGNATYFVTLQPTKESTAKTGFVIVTAENCDTRYHTQQLRKDGDTTTDVITFSIKPDGATKVMFLAHWGTSSCYGYESENNERYIIQGETVEMVIKPAAKDQPPTTSTTAPTTETPTTETTAPTTETTAPTTEPSTAPEPETTQPTETTVPDSTEGTDPTDATESTTVATEPEETTETEETTPETTETEETTSETTEQSQPDTEDPGNGDIPTTETTSETTIETTEQ